MSTQDAIEYNLETLEMMDTNALLRQLICLEHLKMPKREGQLKAAAREQYLIDNVNGFISDLKSKGLTDLARSVEKVKDDWFGGDQ